ncbi:hypothetical protein HTV45_04610 [Streptomyces sp. CHD11]|uniref:hypothetical protein n=1 Tax=Streptomyces sp. CHD11 TaxID=2741325 RepID=UPI001BFC52F3|nr:hypothetical protein [Streptomyces sp. CHD11]MBT3150175.1 hypothetical protein [Streptomyces sp. CHD11]
MITRPDEDPEFGADDPLTVILRPASDSLGPPPGRFEAIRRGAARRRLVRTVAGVGLVCAAGALVVLPLQNASKADRPVSPTVPLAPPPVSDGRSPTPSPPVAPVVTESPHEPVTSAPSQVVPTPAPPALDPPADPDPPATDAP